MEAERAGEAPAAAAACVGTKHHGFCLLRCARPVPLRGAPSSRHRTPPTGGRPRWSSAALCVCFDSAPHAGTQPRPHRMCRRPTVVEGEVGRGTVTFDERAAGAVAALAAGVVFSGRRGSGGVGRPRACPCYDEMRRTPELQVVRHVAFLLSSASDSE